MAPVGRPAAAPAPPCGANMLNGWSVAARAAGGRPCPSPCPAPCPAASVATPLPAAPPRIPSGIPVIKYSTALSGLLNAARSARSTSSLGNPISIICSIRAFNESPVANSDAAFVATSATPPASASAAPALPDFPAGDSSFFPSPSFVPSSAFVGAAGVLAAGGAGAGVTSCAGATAGASPSCAALAFLYFALSIIGTMNVPSVTPQPPSVSSSFSILPW